MKFAVVSLRGHGLPLALKLQEEGHSVKLIPLTEPLVGGGLVPLVQKNGESCERLIFRNVTKDTMIVFTHGEFGALAEALQKAGYLTFGASNFHLSLQQNPAYIKAMNSLYGINSVPEDIGGACAVEAWFNGDDFIYPAFGLFPEYGFMPGDVGPVTECAGVTGFAFRNFRPTRFRNTLEKLRPALRKVDYRGPISVDILGGAALRYVCGFRFDFIYLMMQLLDQPFGKLLADVSRGMVKSIRTKFDYGVCVRATMPPYPHGTRTPQSLAIAADIDVEQGLLPIGLRKEEGKLLTASESGEAFCVCGFGNTIKDAQAQAFQVMSRFVVPDLQFRIDIGALALRNVNVLLQSEKEESGGRFRGSSNVQAQGGGPENVSDEPTRVPDVVAPHAGAR